MVSALLLPAATESGAEILSSKRGFADTGANYNNLQATGATWYYTWGTGIGNPGNFDAEHYPMFWNAPSQNAINNVRSRNPEYVLGFNEPERPDQANMPVSQAISSWTSISNAFTGTNTKLVSPAVSDTGDGQAWITSFMQQAAANNLKVDAVAFHWYGASTPNNPAGAASSFLSRVDWYHQFGKPVFITEFAIHDWGGLYSDEEISEANRQFLDIVIPALESRSYVAGYSWYHWFNDAHLYDGSPSKPTPMAYSYVGAVGSGQVADIGGQDLGEHAAYLTGGELTMTGATPGTIRNINALAGTSTVNGGMNWGLTGSGWVRIQPGAALRKVGLNNITFTGATITNDGVLEVAEGTLQVGSAVTGGGIVRVTGGTLHLIDQGSMSTAPLIDVHGGAVFDAIGTNIRFGLRSGQTLNIERNGMVVGSMTAALGATVSGGGTFAGKLTAVDGSTVRVGGDSQGVVSRIAIDNFESYALGDVRTSASPPWTAHQDTGYADIEDYNRNNVLTYGLASDFRGTSRGLPDGAEINDDESSTFFFRINSKTDDPDHNFGLGDQATTGSVNFGDFEAQLRMRQGTSAGTFALDARNGGSFSSILASGLALNSWYNIWMVVDQPTDTYDIYMNTGTAAATAVDKINSTPLSFRNGTTSALGTILALGAPAPIDNAVRIDDLYMFDGFDLSNPSTGFDPGLVWTAETLTIDGDYTQNAGAFLELDLLDPASHDALHVVGEAELAGTLDISYAVGAPNPQAGDEFDIFEFGSLTGIFDEVMLPALGPGLVWDNSQLFSGGVLKVVAGVQGDYNEDGEVSAADYVAWRSSLGEEGAGLLADGNRDLHVDEDDYSLWRANFGATLAIGSSTNASTAPEPCSGLLLLGGILSASAVRINRLHIRLL